MKKYLLLVLFLSSLFMFTGCEKESIIGKWKEIDSEYELYFTFNDDNTCSYKMTGAKLDCTYKVEDDSIIKIQYNGSDKEIKYNYYFEEDNLIIKDNSGTKYKLEKQPQ